jgi:hypothetical protein
MGIFGDKQKWDKLFWTHLLNYERSLRKQILEKKNSHLKTKLLKWSFCIH